VSAAVFEFLVDGEVRRISALAAPAGLIVGDGDRSLDVEISRISDGELKLRLGGRVHRIFLARAGGRMLVAVDGRQYDVSESRDEPGRSGGGDDGGAGASLRIRAPMPGKVTKIAVSEGEEVRKNQTLVIVEAMKMENEIKTSIDGVVTKVHVAVGELVDAEKALVEVEKT
jgi:biotin carboxyl carrier protein